MKNDSSLCLWAKPDVLEELVDWNLADKKERTDQEVSSMTSRGNSG